MDRDASERLGHANVAFNANVYQHVLGSTSGSCGETFSRLIRIDAPSSTDWSDASAVPVKVRRDGRGQFDRSWSPSTLAGSEP